MVLSAEFDEPIFAIAVGSGWMHVYSTVDSLLTTRDTDAGPPDAVEFFDVRGRRLAPVFDGSLRLAGLRRAGTRADETGVRKRLQAVLEQVRESVDDRLAKSQPTTFNRDQALRYLPDLTGQSLAHCYTLLEPCFGDVVGDNKLADDGSFWHNLFCHCC